MIGLNNCWSIFGFFFLSMHIQADCVVIIGGNTRDAGKWMDDTCDSKRGYVCQTHPGKSSRPHQTVRGGAFIFYSFIYLLRWGFYIFFKNDCLLNLL